MKNRYKILSAFIVFIILLFLSNGLFVDRGQVLTDWRYKEATDELVGDPEAYESVKLPYTEIIDNPGIYEFSTIFTPENLRTDTLQIRRINGYAFDVNLNGQMIYQVGDLEVPTANIWNYSFLIDIPDGLLHEKNILVIRVHGLHDIGFIMEPAIGVRTEFNWITELQNLYSNGIAYMLIGGSFMLGAFLLLVGFSRRGLVSFYTYIGLASLSFGIYSFEYTYRDFTGTVDVYLWIRKILLMAVMFAIIFYSEGLIRMIYEFKVRPGLYILYAVLLMPLVAAPDFHWLQQMTNVYNMVIILFMIILTTIVMRRPKSHLVFSVSFFAMTSIHGIIVFVLGIHTIVLLNYGMMAILIGLSYTMVLDIGELQDEKEELGLKAIMDKLTGAYNREYLAQIASKEGDIISFIDIDYFKKYNDTYGHQKGDDLLCDLVDYVKKRLNQQQAIIRYGGDEFVIFMPETGYNEANDILVDIKRFVNSHFEIVDISYGVRVVHDDFAETLKKSDRDMYLMKQRKRR